MELSRLRTIVSITLILSVLSLRADDSPPPSVNPALIYWQAFSSMEELSVTEARVLGEFIRQPSQFDKIQAIPLLHKREKVLNRFRRAAESLIDCDWGLTYDEGPYLPLPHVSKLQIFSRLALLKAELLFAEQKPIEARKWLLAVHRAARHGGSGDLIIPVLTQFQMEQSVIRIAATHVLDWDEATRLEYLSAWKSLPPLHSVKSAVKGELHFIEWLENFWLQDLAQATQADLPALIKPEQNVTTMTDEEVAEAEKMAAQFTAENVRKWIQEMRDMYQKIQFSLDKPWLEANADLLALKRERENGANLLMQLATPMPLHKVNDLSFKTATMHTMLKAALEHGPLLDANRTNTYKDAFIGNPIELRRTSSGTFVITASSETLKSAGGKIELSLDPPGQK